VQTSQTFYGGSLPQNIRIVYSKKCRYITIQRLIVSVIAESPLKVSLALVLILYDNMLNLEKLASKDPSFKKKFGFALEALSNILKEVKVNPRSLQRDVNLLSAKLKQMKDFHLPQRNWVHVTNRLHDWVSLISQTQSGVERCKLPPKKVIGKGYTDKGSAKKLWLDGSPKWQEIALADLALIKALNNLQQLTRPGKGRSK